MAIITIDTTKDFSLDWGAKGTDRLVQNVYNIINTFKYEVAYNRGFGMAPDILDSDIDRVKGMIAENLIDNIAESEPRAKVKSLDIKEVTTSGDVLAVIVIEI